MTVRLSRPTFVGSERVRTSACGRWRVVTRTAKSATRGTFCLHDVYDRGLLMRRDLDSLDAVRAEIKRIETTDLVSVFRDQDRYFVPEAEADAWEELERRGLVTLHEDSDGDTYAVLVPAERSGAAE